MEGAAVLVVDAESVGPSDTVGLEESAANDNGIRSLVLSILLDVSFVFPSDCNNSRAHTIKLDLDSVASVQHLI